MLVVLLPGWIATEQILRRALRARVEAGAPEG
jgi:hypothetical protein